MVVAAAAAGERPDVIPHMRDALPMTDREALERLVAQRPGVEGKIVALRVEQPGVVVIHTGILRGPRRGGGRVLRATKRDGQWTLEEVDRWRA